MTDDVPRPSWSTPAPGQPPAPEPDAVRPTWDNVPSQPRRSIDLKIVIAVLIGLVSVTGAAVAWKSALAGEQATDKDRQSIAESTALAQSTANNEVIVQDARIRFADHSVAVVTAALLDQQADRLEAAGDADGAALAADEAAEQRAIARRVLDFVNAPVFLANYVDDGADGATPIFDESGLRDDLQRIAGDQARVDPAQTIDDAEVLRDDSQRLDGWLIAMVGAIALLTLAQVNRLKLVRLGLTGLGTAVWVVASVLAFTGR